MLTHALKPFYFDHPVEGEIWIDGVRYVCLGKKAMYGGPDSGRAFYFHQDKIALDHEFEDGTKFKKSVSDPCAYVWVSDPNLELLNLAQKFLITGVHVDDNFAVDNQGGKLIHSLAESFRTAGMKVTIKPPLKVFGQEWHEDDDCVILHIYV